MKQVDKISVAELQTMAEKMFGNIVKAVVDIEKNQVVVDAEMHFDEEQFLLENGSEQRNLWGINLHPEAYGTSDFIEYDSMINIRPRQNNRSRDVEDPEVRKKIEQIIAGVVHD